MDSVVVQGTAVPRIGFGTWNLRGEACRNAVSSALDLGYRHIDTAEFYRNEEDIGAAIHRSRLSRSEMFITSKAWTDHLGSESIVAACEDSLKRLGTKYLDLYLVHWPNPSVPIKDTMEGMQRLLDHGKARHVGVSNFSIDQMSEAEVALVGRIFCNQVRYNVRTSQTALLEECQRQDVLLAAYTPLAKGGLDREKSLVEIGANHNKTPHQVALRWLIQQENVVALPKAANPAHQQQNIDVFDFQLTPEEMAQIGGRSS